MPRGRPRKPRLSRMDAAVDAMSQFGFQPERVKSVVKQLLQEYGGDEGWPFIEDCAYLELINAILRDPPETNEDNVADDDDGNQPEDNSYNDREAGETSIAVAQQAIETSQENLPSSSAVKKPSGHVVAEPEPTFSEVVSSSSGIHNEVGESVVIPSPEGEGKDWKYILQDQTSEQVILEAVKIVSVTNDAPMDRTQSPENSNGIPVSPSLANIPSPPPTNTRPARMREPCYGWIDSDDEKGGGNFICLTPARENVEGKSFFSEVSEHDGAQCRPKRKSRWDQKPGDLSF